MREAGDPHLKRADYIASEMRELQARYKGLADDADWAGDYKTADYYRRLSKYFEDDAIKHDALGTQLVPMF